MIELRSVTKSFDQKSILEDVNVQFMENKVSVILGKSGEGKTTLFRMITSLESIDKGEIQLDENDKIGMVFQGNELFPHYSVMNNLVIPQRVILKRKKVEAIKKADKVLKRLNVSKLKNASVLSLSGGEAQRIAIARELVMDKNIILFDEPTSALDQDNIDILIKLLKELSIDKTIIIITHDLIFAEKVSDYIYKIENKKLILT